MADSKMSGYVGKMLRVDLSSKKITEEKLGESTLKKWVGGGGRGGENFYEAVPSGGG